MRVDDFITEQERKEYCNSCYELCGRVCVIYRKASQRYDEYYKNHWIDLGDGEYKCPKCNREFIYGLGNQTFSKHFPSCPNCGAKMESEVDNETGTI